MFHAASAHGAGPEKRVHHFGDGFLVQFAGMRQLGCGAPQQRAVAAINGGNHVNFLARNVFRLLESLVKEAACLAQATMHAGVEVGEQFAVGEFGQNVDGFLDFFGGRLGHGNNFFGFIVRHQFPRFPVPD